MADAVHEISMPKLGESVTEGTVSRWLKSVGDTVAFDDPLFEVSTDKVDSEIPSPYDGVLLEVLVSPGDTVPVGTPLARIGPAGSAMPGESAPVEESVAPPPPLTTHDAPAAVPGTTPTGAMAATARPAAARSPGAGPPAAAPSAPAGPAHEVSMPKLGESVTEGTVSRWLKSVGDPVAFDDPLFEVSTDKVDSEIPSPYDGVLLEVLVPEGQTVPVGTALARIGEVGAAASAGAPAAGPAAAPATTGAPAATGAAPAAVPRSGNGAGGRALSPVVRRLAAENNLDVSQMSGSGVGGRVMREDVEAAIASGGARTAAPAPATLAPAPAAQAAPAPAAAPTTAAAPKAGPREEVVPLTRTRIVIAERMIESRRPAAHVWTSIEADLERVEQVRQKHRNKFKQQEGMSLTYLPFMARAICDALREYPIMNSSFDLASKTMTFHHYVNLGLAVDVPGIGLMAPVIKDADSMNLRGLARAIREIGLKARDKKLGAADMSGSTFTISNPGPMGTYASAAIINLPNVAIITTEGVIRRPVAVGDAIAIHHTCVLGLSYDHRALDGVVAAQFLKYIRDALQDRDWEAELV